MSTLSKLSRSFNNNQKQKQDKSLKLKLLKQEVFKPEKLPKPNENVIIIPKKTTKSAKTVLQKHRMHEKKKIPLAEQVRDLKEKL